MCIIHGDTGLTQYGYKFVLLKEMQTSTSIATGNREDLYCCTFKWH